MNTFQFFGTGASMGVPVIGCTCSVCRSPDPHNKRLRPSGLLTIGGKKILLDVGTDYRLQALKHNVSAIDGVILTHAHHDHTAGIDELRVYCMRGDHPLPILLSKETFEEMKLRYAYIFADKKYLLAPQMITQVIPTDRGETEFLGIKIGYTTFYQTGMKVLGFRFGDFGYISDIREYPETIFDDLKGVKKLVLSALRFTPTPMHFSVDEALAFSRRVGAEETWLTHISHDLDHEQTNAYLPENVRMAYDGLIVAL